MATAVQARQHIEVDATDAEQVRRCIAGEPEALATLYAQHEKPVRRLVQLTCPGGPVDDLVQDAFVRAIEQLHRYRAEASLDLWLRGIALNVARAHRAKQRRRRGILQRRVPPAPENQVEAAADSRRALQRLQALLERLPDEEREAFALRKIERASLEETAALTGAAVSTVSDRARRAETKLRAWLQEEEEEER